jgi:hypothetical protein
MAFFFYALPFFAALSLLVIGIVRRRQFLFLASFPTTLGGCALALVADGSSAAFSFMAGFILLFGFACASLSLRLQPGSFVSHGGLATIGALFIFLGLAMTMII